MKYIFTFFLCTLWQRLKNGKNWLILLLLPVVILGVTYLTDTETSAPVTVGVVLPESGADGLLELLSEHNNEILSFVATDTDTIDRNIASGKWDCGLVLAEDFEDRLKELDLDRIITLRIGAGSTVYPLVQESVSSCIAQLVAPDIAWEYLLDSEIAGKEDHAYLQARLEGILDTSPRVDVKLSTFDGSELAVPEITQRGIRMFLCWLISTVILVQLLFGTTDLGKWIDSAAAKRMLPLQSKISMMTARAGADSFLMILSGCSAMLLLNGGGWGCLAVFSYTVFWLSASILLAQFPQIHAVVPICLPFVVVSSFLLSSTLVDVSVVLPAISGISRWLPVSLFLRVCKGELSALAVLLAAALLCEILCCVIDWHSCRKAVIATK